MSQTLYNKLEGLIDEEELSYILSTCLCEKEIIALVNKCGISYEGIRTGSVPTRQLIIDLVEDFFSDPNAAKLIIKGLEKNSADASNRINDMTIDEIKAFCSNVVQLVEDKEFGKIVWASISDERAEVNEHAHELLDGYYELIQNKGDNEKLEHWFDEEDDDAETSIQDKNIAILEEKVVDLQLELREKLKEIQRAESTETRLNEKIGKLQNQFDSLKKTCSQFANEKGELREQLRRLEEGNLRLRRKKKSEQEEVEAKQNHPLERENKKLRYDIEKLNQDLEALEQVKERNKQLEVEFKASIEQLEEYKTKVEQEMEELRGSLEKSRGELEATQQKMKALMAPTQEVQRHTGERERVGVFVDVQNMFYAAKDKYGARLDYTKLLDMALGDRLLVAAIAYVVQMPDVDQTSFINFLEHNGYQVRTKDLKLRMDGSAKGDWDMGIAIDIVAMLNDLDVVVLASGDGDFCALLEMVKEKGCRVEVTAFPHNTSVDLQRIADEFFPIVGDMLIM